MIEYKNTCTVIEAKRTESPYESVKRWLGDSDNRKLVLDGWLEVIDDYIDSKIEYIKNEASGGAAGGGEGGMGGGGGGGGGGLPSAGGLSLPPGLGCSFLAAGRSSGLPCFVSPGFSGGVALNSVGTAGRSIGRALLAPANPTWFG